MKIKVTYYNIDKPNKNNHLYSRDILDCALCKFCESDFFVFKDPFRGAISDNIVGKVIKSEWSGHNLIHYIDLYEELDALKDYVYKDKLPPHGQVHFCLFGEGDLLIKEDRSNVAEVTYLELSGMFISDSCAWSDSVIEMCCEVLQE